ncbi:MAG: hypothetical protein Q7S81_01305 [bacterium]|nr:hypothetical protein [bacterium]
MIKRLTKISKFLLIIFFISGWIYSGWPQILNFPPKIQLAQATDSTPTIAGTGADDATVGTQAWTTPEEITVTGGGNDGVYADIGVLAKSEVSDYLKATNFGFTIPDGSTILGIKVEIDRKEGNTQAAGGIKDSEVKMVDEAGAIRSTSKADTTNFWPTAEAVATYGGTADTWGEAGGFWTTTKINDIDFGVVLSAINTKVSGGGATESAQVDFVRITVTYGPASITVGTTGTQTATMNIPSTNQYVGGAFTFVRSGGTANVTSITISETDATLSAQTYLANLDLYYETAGACTYDGTETLFGTDTAFDASEDAVITGTMAVGTSQVCVYAVLDVVSGAPNADTFDLEITNPSTEVAVSAGDVAPATAVAISGATTINLVPVLNQDHFRWRDDDGAEGPVPSTLYFNPTGNGFGTPEFTINAGCTAGSEWDCVDDGTADTQSSAPTSDTTTSELQLAVATDYYTLADGALPSNATITQLNITAAGLRDTGNPNAAITLGYCIVGGSNDCGTSDTMGSQQAFATTLTQQFTSLSLAPADMNNMQLVVNSSKATAAISTVYVLVTYTVPGATWAQNEDTVHTGLAKNTNVRLRFQMDNTGGSASNYNYRLEWAAQSGGSCEYSGGGESYTAVPDTATTEHFDMTTSGNSLFVDGDPTTAQLSNAEAYTFIAGDQVESTSNQSGAITLAQNQYTELEYVFQANANATDSGVYCFRVTNAGTTTYFTADVVAQVTLAGAAGVSITLDRSSFEYGNMANNTSSTTLTLWNGAGIIATNGTAIADFFIYGANTANWTLATATSTSNIYAHRFCNDTDNVCTAPWTNYTPMTTSQTTVLKSSVGAGATVAFQLQMHTPNPSSVYTSQSAEVTVLAAAP